MANGGNAGNAPGRSTAAVPDETAALLAAVLANAPFGFALVDTEFRYVAINEPLAALNGKTPAEHIGLTPADISPVLEDLAGPILRSVVATGESVINQPFSAQPPAGGGMHDLLFSAYPVTGPDGDPMGVAVAIVDVTDRRRTLDRLEEQARQQAAIVELGMAGLRGDSVADLVSTGLRAVREVLGIDKTALLRSDAGGTQFVLDTVEPPVDVLEEVVVHQGDGSITGETLARGEAIIATDAATDPRFATAPSAGDMPVASALTVIIPGLDGPFGVLGAFSQQRREITDDEMRFVQAIANVIGAAVERRRAERALETSDSRLRMAQEAGRMGVWEWDLRTDVVVWSDALEHLWGLPTGGYDGQYESFERMVHADDLARVNEAVSDAVRLGGSYETEHRILRADTGEERWIVARGETIRDENGQPIRLIGINVDITERKVVEEERFSLLRAEQAARAAAERSRERLSFLSEATGVLSASLDYRETLQAVTRLAVPTYADLCIVDLLEAGRLTTAALAHTDPDAEQVAWAMRRKYAPASAADDPTRETLRYGQPLMFTDMSAEVLRAMAVDDRHLDVLRSLNIGSGIVVPLIARGRVLGTLSLIRNAGHEPFDTADDQTLAIELARRTALAIDNARLYAEASRTGERFRRMAETLQASLLPPNLPTVAGMDLAATYRAAAAGTTVGGDFYDVFPLGERGWGVVIGDVQGKGTEAATVTGIARHTIRTAAMRRNPTGSLRVLNEALLRGDEHGGRFCTVLYGQLDVADDVARIEFASGGHPPALLRRADGTVEPVGGGGTLMGVIESIDLNHEQTALQPGDALVLYTDGVTEARGNEGEYGEQRLAEAIADAPAATARELADAIERSVTAFSGGRFRDDIALLVLRNTA